MSKAKELTEQICDLHKTQKLLLKQYCYIHITDYFL